MRVILVLSIFLLTILSSAQDTVASEDLTTTYFFIRHAEKELSDPKNRNPNLTKKGNERAENWAKTLTDINIDIIYTTDYIRTQKTAKPIAESKSLEVTLYDPRNLNDSNFQQKTKGKTIVVVGHNNTTPAFVNKIIGEEKYSPIDEKIYGKLFIVKVTGDVITDTVLTIN